MNFILIKDIPNYEGLYQATNQGEIISCSRRVRCGKGFIVTERKILKPQLDGRGYLCVSMYKDNKKKHGRIHILIALTFIGPRPQGMVINHIDGERLNNLDINIEYCSQRENVNHHHNTRKHSSQYRGVCWNNRHNKWMAQIYINGKTILLGEFKLEIDAHNAYQGALNAYNNSQSIEPFIVKRKQAEFQSKHKHIYWNKSAKGWRITKRIDGKLVHFGSFKTEEEAINALNLSNQIKLY